MAEKLIMFLSSVTENVRSLVSRGKLTQDKANKALTMLKGVLDYSEFKDVDAVIEVGCLTELCNFKSSKSWLSWLLQFLFAEC